MGFKDRLVATTFKRAARFFARLPFVLLPLLVPLTRDSVPRAQASPPPGSRRPTGAASRVVVPRTLAKAKQLYETGDNATALKAFNRLAQGSTRGPALIGSARVLIRTGHYNLALGRLKQAERMRQVRSDAWTLKAEILIRTGAYEGARKLLERAVKASPMHLEARMMLARVNRTLDNRMAAKARYNDFFTDLDNQYLSKSNPVHLMYLGMAARGLANHSEAVDFFTDAGRAAPDLQQNWIEFADLALSKYRVDWAWKHLMKVLRINPSNPEALALLAWVEWYAPRSNHHRGRKFASKALSINPKCIKALLYLASLDIFDAKYARAERTLKRVLGVNPNHLDGLSLLATVYYLTGKDADYKAMADRAFKINPHHARFYTLMSTFVARHHRYDEAAQLNKLAIKADPDDAEALAELGTNLLRIGQYGMGWFHLKEAWKLDQYNHKTYNMLQLNDILPRRYTWIKAGRFRFQVPKDEARIVSRYVPQVMNRALQSYIKKYHVTPKLPVFMELYDKPEDFQTRTFGEPAGAGIMGVCFGRVITSMSPSVGKTNWAYVLWHELAHTMHAHISKWRVPRWFTEGLAEYETTVVKPEWKREYGRHLYRMMTQGAMPGVLDVNMRFTRSKTLLGVVLAYFQSTLIIEFMVKRWGFEKINKALRAYGKGFTTARVLREIYSIEPGAFDKAFKAYIENKFRCYRNQFDPMSFSVLSAEEFDKLAKAHPGDPKILAQKAMFYIYQRDLQKAVSTLSAAVASHPKDPYVLFAQALSHRVMRKHDDEKTILERLVNGGHDSYEGRMRLAVLESMQKQNRAAIEHLKVAARLDPEAAEPHEMMARIYKKLGDDIEVANAAERLALIQQTRPDVGYSVIIRNARLKRWDRVRRFAELALHLQPFNPEIHEKVAWSLRAAKKHKEAIFEFESALLCKPENAHWIHMGIAYSYLSLKDRKKALAHLDEALRHRAEFHQAGDLKRKILEGKI